MVKIQYGVKPDIFKRAAQKKGKIQYGVKLDICEIAGSPSETQLRKIIPDLCVNDVPETVAKVGMSSSNPTRCDPLPEWLQQFHEILVDEEEQRGDSVDVSEDIHDDDQKKKKRLSCCTRRKSSAATSTQTSQSAGVSGTRTDAHPLQQLVCTLRTQEDPMRVADEQDKMKKEENNT